MRIDLSFLSNSSKWKQLPTSFYIVNFSPSGLQIDWELFEDRTYSIDLGKPQSVLSRVPWKKLHLKSTSGTSLVAQWLRIHLPMQGIRVRALVWEDPTCHRATKPVCHNYWACALELASHNYWARVPQLLKLMRLEPLLRNKRRRCNEKPAYRNEE